jgi:hypothetical protein
VGDWGIIYFFFDFTKINSGFNIGRNTLELPFQTAVGSSPRGLLDRHLPPSPTAVRARQPPFQTAVGSFPRGPLDRHLPPSPTAASGQLPLEMVVDSPLGTYRRIKRW